MRALAYVVAAAMDAAERIGVTYDALPSVTSTAEATLAGAPPVWDECPDNVSHGFELGDRLVLLLIGRWYDEERGPLGERTGVDWRTDDLDDSFLALTRHTVSGISRLALMRNSGQSLPRSALCIATFSYWKTPYFAP